jgi:hypothetical protein
MKKMETDVADETKAELHAATFRYLIERLNSGKATTKELAQAVRFLKNNNITFDTVKGKQESTF